MMRQNGYTIAAIAKAIAVHKSTVSRELRRNRDRRSGKYRPDLAQRKYEARMRGKPRRIAFTEAIRLHVERWLRLGFSPEQIAGRSKRDGIPCVSAERIYRHVWEDKRKGGDLYKCLRRRGRKYRQRGAARDSRGIIRGRVGIEHRPAEAAQRQRFGDLEIDTVVGKNHRGAVLTMVDRATGMCFISLLPGKDAGALARAAVRLLRPIKGLLRTITADNGKEFAAHAAVAEGLGVDFYFARPYHSWERGCNENLNGLIRQYIPKGSSFEDLTENDIAMIQRTLNGRPRKRLGFKTPVEYFLDNFATSNAKLVERVAFAG